MWSACVLIQPPTILAYKKKLGLYFSRSFIDLCFTLHADMILVYETYFCKLFLATVLDLCLGQYTSLRYFQQTGTKSSEMILMLIWVNGTQSLIWNLLDCFLQKDPEQWTKVESFNIFLEIVLNIRAKMMLLINGLLSFKSTTTCTPNMGIWSNVCCCLCQNIGKISNFQEENSAFWKLHHNYANNDWNLKCCTFFKNWHWYAAILQWVRLTISVLVHSFFVLAIFHSHVDSFSSTA